MRSEIGSTLASVLMFPKYPNVPCITLSLFPRTGPFSEATHELYVGMTRGVRNTHLTSCVPPFHTPAQGFGDTFLSWLYLSLPISPYFGILYFCYL